MSKRDRTAICRIISRMLDNPGKSGIYPTSTAYTELERYIESERMKAIGWMHAEACVSLDQGSDPRVAEVPEIISRATKDLDHEETCPHCDNPIEDGEEHCSLCRRKL